MDQQSWPSSSPPRPLCPVSARAWHISRVGYPRRHSKFEPVYSEKPEEMPVVPITSVQMKELLTSESETVRIYAEKEWNYTLLQLVKGGIYRFAATPPDQ